MPSCWASAPSPVIELLDAAGCRTVFDPARGGWVPVLDAAGRTSLPFLAAAGDCAGSWPAKAADPSVAQAEGRRAAGAPLGTAPEPDGPTTLAEYRMEWVKALVLDSEDTHVCRCEEVTAREILEVRPPRYLQATWPRNDNSLRALLGAGPPNPDLVKRLTRAGMGVCQGRRCREQVACLLAPRQRRGPPRRAPRHPSRPGGVRCRCAWPTAVEEPEAMRRHWDTWFGMYSQYVPFWDVAPSYTAADRPHDHEAASE